MSLTLKKSQRVRFLDFKIGFWHSVGPLFLEKDSFDKDKGYSILFFVHVIDGANLVLYGTFSPFISGICTIHDS